jgi:hypothetical protein
MRINGPGERLDPIGLRHMRSSPGPATQGLSAVPPFQAKRRPTQNKGLVSLLKRRQEVLSSVFHGKFFRCLQATANLTAAKPVPRGVQLA